MPLALKKAQGLDFIPYTVKDGQWRPGQVFDPIRLEADLREWKLI